MAVYKNSVPFGNIVTDGLVLNLDATNINSYPGSGTTWTDTSFYRNNGTLTNGPTFLRERGRGSIVFDGIDDYVDCGNPLIGVGKLTVNTWIKINTSFIFQHIVDSSSNSWHLAILNDNRPYFWNGVTYHTNTLILNSGIWYMITAVQGLTSDIYVNGILSERLNSNTNVSTGNINLGRWQSGSRPYAGNISATQIYNRALSAQEVQQNFNALKSRFGL